MLRIRSFGWAMLMVMAWGLAGAQSLVEFPHSNLDIISANGRHHRFVVELASTPDQLTQGLMYRSKMAADAGMLFNFGRSRPISMWMKNTLIPLDMLFLDETGRVTGIAARAIPESLAIISSPGPVKAVLEVNSGTVDRLGLAPGDRVVHPWFSAPDTGQPSM